MKGYLVLEDGTSFGGELEKRPAVLAKLFFSPE